MIVRTSAIKLHTSGFADCIDITEQTERCLLESGVQNGLVTVMISGSTAAVTTIEYEPGAISDLQRVLERLVPADAEYAHNFSWGDGNGFSHVRAALMKPSLGIPVVGGKLTLGTWQQVVVLDFDNRSRSRTVIVQVMGD